jgi:ferredoxin
MAKKIIIDTELCEGCETCVEMCPEVFELGEDGKARVKNQDACNTCDCQEAMDSCPTGAMTWEE